MNYLLITSIAFILFSYSNFINLIFKIRLNETFLITICSTIIFSYFLLKLNIYFNLTILDYAYLIILLSAFLFLPIILKNNSKINKKLNLEFLFIFLLIFILSKDRYYLDQDEFSYWGVALKNLTQNIDLLKALLYSTSKISRAKKLQVGGRNRGLRQNKTYDNFVIP